MSRKARNKIRKAFACNKPGAEDFARLVDEYSEEVEMYAAFNEFINGRDYMKESPEDRRAVVCSLLK